jgi:hypothetical protein
LERKLKDIRTNFWKQEVSEAACRNLVEMILERTKFKNGTHRFSLDDKDPLAVEMDRLGLLPEVYNCIMPRMKLDRKGLPSMYSGVEIDLRDFADGKKGCDHVFISLYWEEGGALATTDVHKYDMCCKCACHWSKKERTADAPQRPLWKRILSYLSI